MMPTDPAPSPELAARVATEVMGWYKTPPGIWRNNPQDGTAMYREKDYRPDLHIAQAWGVVEKLVSRGFFVAVEGPLRPKDETWRVSVSPPTPHPIASSVDCDTAPLAICLAALKAVDA